MGSILQDYFAFAADPGFLETGDDFERAADAVRFDRSLNHPQLRQAAAFLRGDDPELAEEVLQKYLRKQGRTAQALHLLAETKVHLRRIDLAEEFIEESLANAPDFAAARFSYANILFRLNKTEASLEQLDTLLQTDPKNPLFRKLRLAVLEELGEYELGAECGRALIRDYPNLADVRMRYGHTLRGLGRHEECVAAYRKAIELSPEHGASYWSLANLKTFRFTEDELANMQHQLKRTDLTAENRTYLHFALGKAYADAKRYAESFDNYAKGNAIHRLSIDDDPDILTAHVAGSKKLLTRDFFEQRRGFGCDARDPIFIVGMPRAGSTLVEQILASHSQIEGIKELPDLTALGRQLEARVAPLHGTDYPGVLAKLDSDFLAGLGRQYLSSTALHRKLGRPFFTDKMGSNYLHIGLIQLILPNAKIIDARRHPMACCFSNFTQHFVSAQTYSYRLTDLGRSYYDYVDLMRHFDRALPGKVHRLIYEHLVADPEREIRSLLEYLELPFEEACLQFHKTERIVTTVSSEQVRQPIFKDGLDLWRHYEEWLGPLKRTLGPVLEAYPEVPAL